MKTFESVVKYFVITVVSVVIIFDIFASIMGYTISNLLRDLVFIEKLWIIPYYTAIVIGHLWIPIYDKPPEGANRLLIAFVVLAFILNMTILNVYVPWYVTLPSGLVTGALFWPQRRIT